jgi:hypothetical protein
VSVFLSFVPFRILKWTTQHSREIISIKVKRHQYSQTSYDIYNYWFSRAWILLLCDDTPATLGLLSSFLFRLRPPLNPRGAIVTFL